MEKNASLKTLMQNDIPAWIPPTVVKELRQGMRTSFFSIMLCLLPCLLAILFIIVTMLSSYSEGELQETPILTGVFWGILILGMGILMPLQALDSLKPEIDSRSIDLLLLSNQTPWKIVAGKWCAGMLQSSLVLLTTIPFLFLRYFYGSVDLVSELVYIGYLFVLSGTFMAIAIWMSGLAKILRVVFLVVFILLLLMITPGFYAIAMFGSSFGGGPTLDAAGQLIPTACYCVIISLCFLILASRWIANPSANTSILLRPLVLAPLLTIPIYMLIFGFSESISHIPSSLLVSANVATLIFIADLISRNEIKPVHFSQVNHTRFSSFKKIFLLPGFFSASMALTLYTALAIAGTWLVFSFYTPPIPPGEAYAPISIAIVVSWTIILWWFSVHSIAFFVCSIISQPKGPYSRPVTYILLSFGISTVVSPFLLFSNGVISTIIPWVSLGAPSILYLSEDSFKPETPFAMMLTVVISVIGLIVIWTSRKDWVNARQKAKELSYLND